MREKETGVFDHYNPTKIMKVIQLKSGKKAIHCELLDVYIVILERWQNNDKARCQYVLAMDGPQPVCKFWAHMN